MRTESRQTLPGKAISSAPGRRGGAGGKKKESAMTYYTRIDCPFCEIIVAGDEDGLRHLHLNTGEGKRRFEISREWQHKPSFFNGVVQQLRQYFTGVETTFSVRLNPQGTAFQKKVWQELCAIPYGRVSSYKDIARAIGNEKAARAVGMANAKNPIPIIIPCHRVIGVDGSLAGFAHGVAVKDKLLRLEGVLLREKDKRIP